jgi:hypothetical protein
MVKPQRCCSRGWCSLLADRIRISIRFRVRSCTNRLAEAVQRILVRPFSLSPPLRPVPLFDPLPDGGLPVIETEQSAEPFATNDATGPGHVLLFTRGGCRVAWAV